MEIKTSTKVCNRECRFCIEHILEDLESIEDGSEKLQYIVELARDIPCLKEEFKQDSFKVKGCMSNLWLVPEVHDDGKCYFYCDGDAIVPKGIAFIVSAIHSGYTPEEILSLDLSCLQKLGLEKFLSPNRRNSVSNLSKAIHQYALDFLSGAGCQSCPMLQTVQNQ